jgi:hypothetical protein
MHPRNRHRPYEDDDRNGEARRNRTRARDEERGGYEQFERERGYGSRGREGYDPERDRYAEPGSREFRRGDRDFQRDPRGSHREYEREFGGQGDRYFGERSFGRGPRERWEAGGWESEPRRFDHDERGERSYPRYGSGAYAQGGYNQGGYNQGSYDQGRLSQGGHGHQGRGPRGYKRSDERIREDVCDCLMQDPQIDASDIEIKVSEGTVTLEGTVESRRIKHMAENLCDSIAGVQEVTNHLRIKRQESDSASSQPSSRSRNAGMAGGGGSNIRS